jgi:type II secretory pathway component PulK
MRQKTDGGSTLIMVTWMVMLIAGVAEFLLYRASLEWAVTLNFEQKQQVREIARAALMENLALLAADENDYDAKEEAWFHKTGIFTSQRSGYQVTLVIEAEDSKPQLNLLSEKGLTQLLGDDDSARSPDPVLDWIDSDGELRAEGAEAPYYQGLNPAYRPRDGFMASLHELLQVKDGAGYYAKLAPAVTVYGKYNPNTLTGEKFAELLLAYGFDKFWVERVRDEFSAYREKNRFESLDDFAKLASVSLATRDKLRPLLQFSGSCNLNFVSKDGLKAILSEAGQKTGWAAETFQRVQAQPFTTIDEIKAYFKNKNVKFKAQDYFTVTSSLFHYRIWLVKKQHTFYLETVQERMPGGMRRKWQIRTVAWLELQDAAAPPLPSAPAEQTQKGEDRENAAQSDHH